MCVAYDLRCMSNDSGRMALDREALQEAMDRHGHNQRQCAEYLARLGLKATQSQVSNWLSGATKPRRSTLTKLQEYAAEAGVDMPGRGVGEHAFGYAVDEALLAGTPGAEPRQPALLDALIERLRTGPALSPDDKAVTRTLFALLGLSPAPSASDEDDPGLKLA